jgi:uncharacterized membrane protein YdbT with pleckstrin-like domain
MYRDLAVCRHGGTIPAPRERWPYDSAMGFPRKYLHEGEEIVLDRRPHKITLAVPVLLGFVACVALIVRGLTVDGNGPVAMITTWLPIAVVVLAALLFLQRWTRWRTTHFVLTTDRLIYRSGVLAKNGREIPLERINDISFKQTIWERMIRAGDLLIESGGEQGQQRFSNVKDPFDVQNQIYRQLERSQARDMDRMAGRQALSAPEQIEKLHDLHVQGILTLAEFEAKKTQLLGLDPGPT